MNKRKQIRFIHEAKLLPVYPQKIYVYETRGYCCISLNFATLNAIRFRSLILIPFVSLGTTRCMPQSNEKQDVFCFILEYDLIYECSRVASKMINGFVEVHC